MNVFTTFNRMAGPVLCAALTMVAIASGNAQTPPMGTQCQVGNASCIVAPQPVGTVCFCSGTEGRIAG